MWCEKCGYALDGLSEERCPECGLSFDPGNAKTFRRRPLPPAWRFPTILAAAAAIILIAPAILIYKIATQTPPVTNSPPVMDDTRVVQLMKDIEALRSRSTAQGAPDSIKRLANDYSGGELSMFRDEIERLWETVKDDPEFDEDVKSHSKKVYEKSQELDLPQPNEWDRWEMMEEKKTRFSDPDNFIERWQLDQ
jgi:hypothetical protein